MEATKYHIFRGILFRRGKIRKPPLRVVCQEDRKTATLTALHHESGHRGRDGTVKKVMERYWWRNVYRDAGDYVKSCNECQHRINIRVEQELHPNLTSTMWHRVLVDVVHVLFRSPIEPFTNQVHAILVEPFTNLQYWWLVRTIRQSAALMVSSQHKVQQTCFKNVHIMPAHV